jgi:hypothetical protein
MVIPGGGLNSTVAGLANHPFNPMEEFKGEYRVIAADLRNAISAVFIDVAGREHPNSAICYEPPLVHIMRSASWLGQTISTP